MKLSAKAVSSARFEGKSRKLFDGHGLYLHVTSTSRTWRYKYRLGGREKTFTIGPLELYSLSHARELHREARRLVAAGMDPVEERKREKGELSVSKTNRALLEDWIGSKTRAASDEGKIRGRLKHLSVGFLERPSGETTADHVLTELLNAAEKRSGELAQRIRSYVSAAYELALADDDGTLVANPAKHPKIKLRVPPAEAKTPYAHITDIETLRWVLRVCEDYAGDPGVAEILWLSPRLFLRPTELRALEWSEVDLEAARLVLPAARMGKTKLPHLVPLARQCVAVLRGATTRRLPGAKYVWPGMNTTSRPLSPMTITQALVRVGVEKTTLVPHGWRHTASTFLNERTFMVDGAPFKASADAIEMQLAHVPRGVRAVYNRAKYLEERITMMQAWADWLDGVRDGREGEVVTRRSLPHAAPDASGSRHTA